MFAGRRTPWPVPAYCSSLRREAEREDRWRLDDWNLPRIPQFGLSPRMPAVIVNRSVRRWAWLSSSSFDELKTIFLPDQWPRRKHGLVRLDPSNHSKIGRTLRCRDDRSELRIDVVGEQIPITGCAPIQDV